jgi:hypothetical protein
MGDRKAIAGYTPPAAMSFERGGYSPEVLSTFFLVETPEDEPCRYERDSQRGITVASVIKAEYSSVENSTVTLDFYFFDEALTEPSRPDAAPDRLPPIVEQLSAVDVLLNGHPIARVFDASQTQLVAEPDSATDPGDRRFHVPIVLRFRIDREMIAKTYDFDG